METTFEGSGVDELLSGCVESSMSRHSEGDPSEKTM